MSAIRGTFIDGKIVPDAPVNWTNETRVVMEAINQTRIGEEEHGGNTETLGMSEEKWDDSPKGIAAWLAWYETLPPFLTPDEEAAWKQAREEDKAQELKQWQERSLKLEKLFE
jgi:hypothetical protein